MLGWVGRRRVAGESPIFFDLSRQKGRGGKAGAWLALAAMLIQALIPNLIAAEITLAVGNGTAFLQCPFGHVHAFGVAAASEGDVRPVASSPRAGDPPDTGGLADACSICIALYTVGHFTTPDGLDVTAPHTLPEALRPLRPAAPTALVVPATYDARAPPLIA